MILYEHKLGIINWLLNCISQHNLARDQDEIIITGSLSIEIIKDNNKYQKFFDGTSDVDLFIVLGENPFEVLNHKFDIEIINKFTCEKLNILNYTYSYGIGRNKMNIKYIKEKNFLKLCSFKTIEFTSYRRQSLVQKKAVLKVNSKSNSILLKYDESKDNNGFCLRYNFSPFIEKEYYLSDIHAMLLFGIAINPKIESFINCINQFNIDIFNIIGNYTLEELCNLLAYFVTNSSLDKMNLYEIINKFMCKTQGGNLMVDFEKLFFERFIGDWRKMSVEDTYDIINNKCENIISKEELKKLLESGKKLTVKFGIDPTAKSIHMGHIVPIILTNVFIKLGHDVQFIIGDFTAKIGDPSGQNTERRALSVDDITENFSCYENQISKFIDINKISIRYNSEWLNSMNARQVFELFQNINLSQAIQRDDFRKRIASQSSISLAEVCYATLMGVDSITLKADIEIGGIDQLLNFQQCRLLMKMYDLEAEVALMTGILQGTSGDGQKMSKSLNNYISADECLDVKFGKIMSITDEQIFSYFQKFAYIKSEEVGSLKKFIDNNPFEAKKMLASYIVSIETKDLNTGKSIKNDFERKFSRKKINKEDCLEIISKKSDLLFDCLFSSGKFSSKGELKRLFLAGAVKRGDDIKYCFSLEDIILEAMIVKVGKRLFFYIIMGG